MEAWTHTLSPSVRVRVPITRSFSRRVHVCTRTWAPSNFIRMKWPSRGLDCNRRTSNIHANLENEECGKAAVERKRGRARCADGRQTGRQAKGKTHSQIGDIFFANDFPLAALFDSSTMMDVYDGWFIASSGNLGKLQTPLAWVIIRQIMAWFRDSRRKLIVAASRIGANEWTKKDASFAISPRTLRKCFDYTNKNAHLTELLIIMIGFDISWL